MAINFDTDIVTGFFSGSVATDPAYQSPGTFGLPSSFGDSDAEQRILCMVELFRSLMHAITTTQEAKLARELMAKMGAAMRFGAVTWDATTMSAEVQDAALRFLASHVISASI